MKSPHAPLTRRAALRRIGLSLAAVPAAKLLSACGGDSGEALGDTSVDAASGGDTSDVATASDTATGFDTGPDDVAAATWATGGTAAMSGGYPDPFTAGLGTTCALACAMTLGPCYAQTVDRQDVSEGHPGLPTRLAFKVVDEGCAPVAGATVDIWHTSPGGLYSGSDANDFCTAGDPTERAHRWFRGVRTTDADGRADFDTCFPGWYPGRTIHIHFTVRVAGQSYVTSQLFFPDALSDEIIATQPLYDARGPRDTTNRNDSVIAPSAVDDYTLAWARQPDGALLAWKAVVIRSSLATSLCSAPG